jgi:hypothetical protein
MSVEPRKSSEEAFGASETQDAATSSAAGSVIATEHSYRETAFKYNIHDVSKVRQTAII